LLVSKESAAQVRLKVALVGDDAGHNFAFTSPKAQSEREKFKAELTVIVSRNRTASETAARAPVVAAQPSPVSKSVAASPQRPLISQTPSRAVSVSSNEQRNVTIIPGNDPATDVRLRKTVLMSDPELGALHRELVAISGQLSEAEFWDGREVNPLLLYFSFAVHCPY
jgi:transcription initiation factor TFIIH subunit 1